MYGNCFPNPFFKPHKVGECSSGGGGNSIRDSVWYQWVCNVWRSVFQHLPHKHPFFSDGGEFEYGGFSLHRGRIRDFHAFPNRFIELGGFPIHHLY